MTLNLRSLGLLTDKQFAQVCPNFVVELQFKTDAVQPLREKMMEYQQNGARLGWLINPQDRQVEVYRLGQSVEVLAAVVVAE